MSLTLWEFFWTESDWTGAPPAVSASAAEVVVAKFGSRGHDYRPATEDFWEARERYIRRFIEPTVQRSRQAAPAKPQSEHTAARLITKASIAQAKLSSLHTERDILLANLQLIQVRGDFQRDAAKILQISLDILDANNEYYEQAAIILLLDIY